MKRQRLAIIILVLFIFTATSCSNPASLRNGSDKPVASETISSVPLQNNPGGTPAAPEESSSGNIDFSKVVRGSDAVHINQIGYVPEDAKIAMINGKEGEFLVYDAASGNKVFEGQLTGGREDAATGDTVYYGDFSQLRTPGSYCIVLLSGEASYPFSIRRNVYKDIKNAMIKGFYYQRCGMALEESFAGVWKHEACHLGNGSLFSSPDVVMDVSGGWHDAGDYGRYVSAGATAVGHLLLAYERMPKAFGETLNIPESGNGVPDILNEVRYELDWMLKMQDKGSGGVYHKVATPNWPGFVLPERDTQGETIYNLSPTSTADFAAVMAMASRIYQPFDIEFSQKALGASKSAWKWLEENPDAPGFKNPQGANSGEYGDSQSGDERLWAAAELFEATGEETYYNYFSDASSQGYAKNFGFGWNDMSGFAAATFLFGDRSPKDGELYNRLKTDFITMAGRYAKISQYDGYKTSMTASDYYWGSNMGAMNKSLHMILAYMLSPDESLKQAAKDNFNYLLGANALNQCYVTGYGSKPVMNPHHRPSGGDGVADPVPGLVAGGPNSALQDPDAQQRLKADGPPARAYVDVEGSYSTNEIAIYWNSPAVFVAAFFDSGE